jgi:hypothetical protein
MVNSPQQGRPALKWGLIFGGALALISIISSTIQYMTGSFSQLSDPAVAQSRLGTNLLLGCGSFILEAAIYFFAGMLTARENGKVGSGALAGLLAAAVGTVVGGAITIVTFLNISLTPPAGSGIDPAQYAPMMKTIILISAVVGVVIGLGIGTGIAALGGLVGRGQYESAHPLGAMEGSMYMPTSPAGAPYPYAPPPGYPAPGAPGIYPPPTGSSAGESSQYPPAPGVYPPPPGTTQPPQQPQ